MTTNPSTQTSPLYKRQSFLQFSTFVDISTTQLTSNNIDTMKHLIAMIYVSLTVCVLMASAQLPAGTWNNPYSFYSNINTPLAMAPQIILANEMAGNQKVFSGHDDYSMANTLGSHVVMLSTCLRELKTTKADLAQTHTVVETVKNELKGNSQLLANVMATVENLKKEMNANAASTSIGRMPKSCEDLHKIGHRKSGLFSVMGNKTVDNVYCDFTKPTNDAGFQKKIGYVDVKTSPVYFHAQRTSAYSSASTALPFDSLRLNIGNAMSTSGIFVAPKSGKYFFTFSCITDSNKGVRVQLQVKVDSADWARVGTASGATGYQSSSLQSTVELAQGNQIRLLFVDGSTYDDGVHYTNFVGQLLEEDIIQ